MTKSWILWN